MSLASSRGPTWRSSTRALTAAASSRTSWRKSTRPSALKKTVTWPQSRLASAVRTLIGNWSLVASSAHLDRASRSFARTFSSRARSSGVARRSTGFSGSVSWLDITCLGAITTRPILRPRSVSAIIWLFTWRSRPLGAK